VNFVKKVIGKDSNPGLAENFQAVPGCGLKCTVSKIDTLVQMAQKAEAVINFTNESRYCYLGYSFIFAFAHFALISRSGGREIEILGVLVEDVPCEIGAPEKTAKGLQQLLNIDDQPLQMEGPFEVLVGNREWMKRNAVEVPTEADLRMIDEEEKGNTAVLCSVNGIFYF